MENKLVKGLATVGVVTLGLGSATVYADETTVPVTETTETTTVAVEAPVTADQVTEAKSELDASKEAVSNGQTIVEQVQTEVTEAEVNVSAAQADVDKAQELVDEATPETIAAQKTAITDADEAVKQAEEAVANAETTVSEAKSAASEQNKVVTEAQKAVSQEQTDVNQAQTAVNNAQAILDGTGQAEVVAEKEAADLAVAEAEARVSVAEGNLEKAKEADKTREISLDAAQTGLDNAGVQVANMKSSLDQATDNAQKTATTLSEAAKELSSSTQLVDALSKELANKNTITVPSGYADVIKAFAADKSESNKAAVGNASTTGVSSNQFKSLDSDKAIVVSDINGLSQAQREELTLFAVDLINQVREQVGALSVVANKSAISFADDVANTSTSLGHDLHAIPAAAGRKGLESTDGVNYYEDFSSGYFDPRQTVTMDDLKKAVYNTIVEMLFDDADSSWGHATSLAGVRTTTNSKYVGLDVSKLDYIFSNGNTMPLGRVHILGVSDEQIEDANKFDTSSNLTSRNIENELATAKSAQSAAQAELTKAQTANQTAKEAQTLAQSNYNSAIDAQAKAQEELSYWQNKAVQTPVALTALQNAKDSLTSAQTRAKAAQDAVDALTADVATKKANLDKAKTDLATQKAELEVAKANFEKEKTELESLQAKVADHETTLKKAKSDLKNAKANQEASEKRLNNLLNADDILAVAQSKLDAVKAILAKKAATLNLSKANLVELLKKQVADQKAYDELLVRYTAQEEAKHQAELEAKKAAIEKAGQVATPVVNKTGKIVDYVASQKQVPSIPTKQPVSYQTATSSGKGATLPQTGEAGGLGLLTVGMISILSALGLANKRKKG